MRLKLPLSLPLPLTLIAALVAVLGAGGCGGDDGRTAASGNAGAESGSGSTSGSGGGERSSPEPLRTAKLNKARYIKRAEATCARNEKKQAEAVASYREDNPESLEEGGGGFEGSLQEVYLPMKEEELEELRALGAPAGDKGEVEAIWTAFEKFVRAAQGPEGASSAAVNRLAVRAGRLAVEYGLRECA